MAVIRRCFRAVTQKQQFFRPFHLPQFLFHLICILIFQHQQKINGNPFFWHIAVYIIPIRGFSCPFIKFSFFFIMEIPVINEEHILQYHIQKIVKIFLLQVFTDFLCHFLRQTITSQIPFFIQVVKHRPIHGNNRQFQMQTADFRHKSCGGTFCCNGKFNAIIQ